MKGSNGFLVVLPEQIIEIPQNSNLSWLRMFYALPRKVKVEFSLENMEITSFRGKATYAQIKDYVLQQTGMKVSSLYISQVKRKCGLEIGDSYNKPKTEDAKQPQCPPEKEAAIMDALKHFGIIE